jgi:hypothetical protein
MKLDWRSQRHGSRVLKLRYWVQSQPEAYASEKVMSLTTSSIAGPSLTRFEVALFFLHFPWGNRYSQNISDV